MDAEAALLLLYARQAWLRETIARLQAVCEDEPPKKAHATLRTEAAKSRLPRCAGVPRERRPA
jgi:hypothetical protein